VQNVRRNWTFRSKKQYTPYTAVERASFAFTKYIQAGIYPRFFIGLLFSRKKIIRYNLPTPDLRLQVNSVHISEDISGVKDRDRGSKPASLGISSFPNSPIGAKIERI